MSHERAPRTEAVDEASGFAKAGNDYVQRVRGTFTAPADGEYVFAVASDDDGLLLASPSGDPAALAPVATVAALRETSVLFAAVLGTWLLKEPFSWRRGVGTAVILSGVMALRMG